MKLSKNFLAALEEYEYFADLVKHGDMYLQLNSKMPIYESNWWEHSAEGLTAEETLYVYESQGKRKPCKDIPRLKRLFAGKSAREWHLSEWYSGIKKGLLHYTEFLDLPDTVYQRLMKSVYGEFLPLCVREKHSLETIRRKWSEHERATRIVGESPSVDETRIQD